MADPTAGGGDLLARIVIQRQGGELIPQTRGEIAAMRQDFERFPAVSFDAPTQSFSKLNKELTQGEGSLRHVRTAMTGLALEATATKGPVGELASSLLLFGGGSGLVLGIAAGVGAIAGAYRLATAETRHLREETDLLNKQYRDLLTKGAPNVALQNALTDAIQKEADAEQELANLQRVDPNVESAAGVQATRGTEIANAQAAVSAAQRVVADLKRELAESHADQVKSAAQKAADAWVESFLDRLSKAQTTEQIFALKSVADDAPTRAAGKRAGDAWRAAFLEAVAASGGTFVPRISRTLQIAPFGGPAPDLLGLTRPDPFALSTFQAGARQLGGQGMVDEQQRRHNQLLNQAEQILERLNITHTTYNAEVRALDEALAAGTITSDQYKQAIDELNKKMGKATQDTKLLAVAIIGAVSGAIAAVLSGGSAGSVLSAIGGVVGLIPGGQIAGAAIGGLGTIVSGIESGSKGVRVDSYGQAAIDQMRALGQQAQRVVVQILNPTTGAVIDEIEYELGRRRNRDAVQRLPTLVGAG